MSVRFFKNSAEFRNWLKKNHKLEKELLVGFFKVSTGKPSITWSESVDQALCYGWIDGIRKSIDNESYCIRFTPRNPKSNWSAVNIKKVEDLIQKELMQPEGLKVYQQRKADKSEVYSYENKPPELPSHFEKVFKTNKKAWKYFNVQTPSYKKTRYYWILSAKQEKTQILRLNKLISSCEEQKKLF